MKHGETFEPLVWHGHPDWSEYIFLWFFSIVFAVRAGFALRMGQRSSTLIFSLGVALFVGMALFLRQRTSYRVTRREVYKSKGVLGSTNHILPLSEIVEIDIQQGPLDRVFGIGTLFLKNKAGKVERLNGIKDPEVLDRKIKALL